MIMKVIREEPDRAGAKVRLAALPFELSEAQAEAVLGLQLGRLTNLDQVR